MPISRNLHKKRSEVSIKTRSTPASLSFKGQATKHTTVKWPIAPYTCTCDFLPTLSNLQVIGTNPDWLNMLFAPVVIGQSKLLLKLGLVIWKLLYNHRCFIHIIIIMWISDGGIFPLKASVTLWVSHFCTCISSEIPELPPLPASSWMRLLPWLVNPGDPTMGPHAEGK